MTQNDLRFVKINNFFKIFLYHLPPDLSNSLFNAAITAGEGGIMHLSNLECFYHSLIIYFFF